MLVSAATAEGCATAVLAPLEVLKLRVQVSTAAAPPSPSDPRAARRRVHVDMCTHDRRLARGACAPHSRPLAPRARRPTLRRRRAACCARSHTSCGMRERGSCTSACARSPCASFRTR
eukprot:3693756-Prymnesium_polylepis.3